MPNVVALDIGGTKIEGALFNARYKQLKKMRVKFEKKKSESVVNLSRKVVLGMITDLIDELKKGINISGIGISIPDVITKDGSFAGTAKITALSRFSLGKYLRKKYCCKVSVNNDADCIAYGEAKLGAGKGYRNVIGIIWGTGIGAGLVVEGNIYSGTTGSAGEFGHNVLDPKGPAERTGQKGTIEAYSGGPDLIRLYRKFGGKKKDATPKTLYRMKEPAAKKVTKIALEKLCIGLAGLMNTLNPGVIIMGGGQSNLPVYKELNRLTKKYTFEPLKKYVKIVKNKLGDSAGIYGAAALAFGH